MICQRQKLHKAVPHKEWHPNYLSIHFSTLVLMVLTPLVFSGCAAKTIEGEVRKKPRPIQVMELSQRSAPSAANVSASVASWKTEQIGFEVSGRVEWVIEPGSDVEGRIFDEDGNLMIEGTPVARIDSERYRLQKESAAADVKRSEQSVESVRIELEKSIPSQMRAAEAELKLAQTELTRSERLVERNAGAQADVDRDQANFENAQSRIEQLEADLKAKEAERTSLLLQVEKAKQALRDAERNLEDCVLYSSFRGQIAAVDVVPGSVVSPGQPVATVQMMDPIKIELEVSAEDSRRLRKRQRIPVIISRPGLVEETKDGFLYLIDPVGDPQTRTYTLTLLMLNERNVSEADELANIPVTDQTWRLDFKFLPGAEEGRLFAPEQALRQDADGPFLWRALNLSNDQYLPPDNLVDVAKMRVRLGESRFPFLGNWVFQEVILDDETFDPQKNLIVGKLAVGEGDPNDWVGEQVRVDRDSQWKVRPGDLVKVDLSDGVAQPGIFVPMDSVSHEGERTFIFVVEEAADGSVVRKTEVLVDDTEETDTLSELVRIRPIQGSELLGSLIATRGVHYLRDGENVLVNATEGVGE